MNATASCPATTPQIQTLVDGLDADDDPLHSDITPSVLALARLDLAGACAVLEQLTSAEQDTRMHAERVLEYVLDGRCGFTIGRGFRDQYGEEYARETARAIGYSFDDTAAARASGAARWRAWVQHELVSPAPPPSTDGPSRDEMVSALDTIRPLLVRCGEPVDLHVTFERSGTVSSIYREDADASYQQCVSRAATSVHVRPFVRDSVWIKYGP